MFIKPIKFFVFFLLIVSNAHALIREVVFSTQEHKELFVPEFFNNQDSIIKKDIIKKANIEDRFFIVSELNYKNSIAYELVVFHADGSSPYKAHYSTKLTTPLATLVKPSGTQIMKTMKIPDQETATILIQDMANSDEDSLEKVQTKILYHKDEILSTGIIQEIVNDDGTSTTYHKVLVRENSQFGSSYYGLLPVGQAIAENFGVSSKKPLYKWEENALISFDKSSDVLSYEDGDLTKEISLKDGLMFQYESDVDGGRKGSIVKLNSGAKAYSKNPLDYTVLKADIILSERLIPYKDISQLKMNGVIEEFTEEIAKAVIVDMEGIKKQIPLLVKPKIKCEVESEPVYINTVKKPVMIKGTKQNSSLSKQILCAVRKRTGIRSRRLGDLYINKMGPILDKLLKDPYGPTSEIEKTHFLAQLLHETGGFGTMVERRPTKCWQSLDKMTKTGKDIQVCSQFKVCAEQDNNYFMNPTVNSKGVTLRYTHKDKFRGRFPIQLTHCSNYLGFFKHLDLLAKGKKAEAMKYNTYFSASKGKAGSHCTDAQLSALVKENKSADLDPLGVLLSGDPTKALNNLASPCESVNKKSGLNSMEIMAKSALWYWKTNPNCKAAVKSLTTNTDSVVKPTRCINGGTNGLADRKAYLKDLQSCMKEIK